MFNSIFMSAMLCVGLARIGQLLKRDQGSRESLADDKLVAARHRSQIGSFWSTHGARPFGLSGHSSEGPFPIAWLGNHNLGEITSSCGVSKTSGPDVRGDRSPFAPCYRTAREGVTPMDRSGVFAAIASARHQCPLSRA